MSSIIYVGMDVHTNTYSVCALKFGRNEHFGETCFEATIENVLKYLDALRKLEDNPDEVKFICGYEAGCLGYSLYRQLTSLGIECRIMAPSTMAKTPMANIKKNDRLDARRIAECLAYGTHKCVYVTDEEDESVKEYIRMRDDAKAELKRVKQQIIAFCTRHGKRYCATKHKWTKQHREWLKTLELTTALKRETLDEYICRLNQLEEKLEMYDNRIKELASNERYCEAVKKLECFKGIATHTALSFVAEIGDFNRFPTASHFASYLGLTPGEHSSGGDHNLLGITKAGNSHLRRLLVEAAQSFNRGSVGYTSKVLKTKQAGNSKEVINYANRANERLRRKYIRMIFRSSSNVAKTAIARELACFIWGMMTDHIS